MKYWGLTTPIFYGIFFEYTNKLPALCSTFFRVGDLFIDYES